ncbi:unnamed protein product [Brassica oleracea]
MLIPATINVNRLPTYRGHLKVGSMVLLYELQIQHKPRVQKIPHKSYQVQKISPSRKIYQVRRLHQKIILRKQSLQQKLLQWLIPKCSKPKRRLKLQIRPQRSL